MARLPPCSSFARITKESSFPTTPPAKPSPRATVCAAEALEPFFVFCFCSQILGFGQNADEVGCVVPFIDSLRKFKIACDPWATTLKGGSSRGLSRTSKILILLRTPSSWGSTLIRFFPSPSTDSFDSLDRDCGSTTRSLELTSSSLSAESFVNANGISVEIPAEMGLSFIFFQLTLPISSGIEVSLFFEAESFSKVFRFPMSLGRERS